MKNTIKSIMLFTCLLTFVACSPIDENLTEKTLVASNPNYSEGLLMKAYTALINQYSTTCEATDDAVNNQTGNSLHNMATGQLSAQNNPLNRWGLYKNVFYLNQFLSIVDGVKWIDGNEEENALYIRRMKGEALALRALYHFYILQAHGGMDESGKLMGIPYYTSFVESNGDFNVPRLSYEATVDSIDKDFNDAYELLPYVYSDNADDIKQEDRKFDENLYVSVNGSKYNLRIQGQIVRAFQARLHLMAASPAFMNSKEQYELAIKYAAPLCQKQGFNLASDGVEFYNADDDKNNPEILWRGSIFSSSSFESNNYPYSLQGNGQINPSQNLVDAFYKADGYPINSVDGVAYNAQKPYENRDPRLAKYILFNGGKLGSKTITINDTKDDGVDKVVNKSTRTGYYLKKLLRSDVVIPVSGNPTPKDHFNIYFRYTELFLILAEAQNEIGGPDYKANGVEKSAKEIIADIRHRALALDPDPYLDAITTKDAMQTEIRNERRLELCFEGFRFWDLRRYKAQLDEEVKGVNCSNNVYSIMNVESRDFKGDKYYYMPLPYSETMKYSNLTQNVGW